METSGMEQRVTTLEEEVRLLRSRSHDFGNKLTEQGSHLDDSREDIKDLRFETNRRFDALDEKIDKRFDKLSAQGWKIAGFALTAMILAATIVSLVAR